MWRGCKSSPFRLRQWQSPLRDDATFYLPFRSYRREAIPLEEEHGEVVSVSYLPANATELDMILRRERFKTSYHAKTGSIEDHIHKLAVLHGVTEKLGILPLEAQTAYKPSRKPIPKRLSALPRTATSRFTVKMRRRQRPRSAQSS